MKQEIKNKTCRDPECEQEFTPRKSTDKFCSWKCASKNTKPIARTPIKPPTEKPKRKRIQRIKPMSDKMKREVAKYHRDRLVFLGKPENKICPVTNQPTTDVHHKKGRVGYADEFARENDISLLHDQRFWLAVSRSGHRWIEEHPIEAKERGWSFDRLT